MRNERGEIVLAVIVAILLIAGAVSVTFFAKCDPAVQQCVSKQP